MLISIAILILMFPPSCLPSRFVSRPQPDMIGYYLAEFSITYKPITHGRPGVGGAGASKFMPLK